MPIYYHADGKPSRYPTDKEYAINIKSPFYDDGVKCVKCGQMSVKYTHGDECRFCTMSNAVHFYNLSVNSKLVYVDAATGKPMAKIAFRPDVEIDRDAYSTMLELLEISRSGDEFSVSTEACKVKAHYGLKRYGKCHQCTQDKLKPSPRKQAMMNGETWYTPDKECPRCGTFADRNVHNGTCKGCVTPSASRDDQRTTPDVIMMRDAPDTIVSREDAKSYGFKVYRTGQPCRRGHTGWRYVSTGNCIDCLRGGE